MGEGALGPHFSLGAAPVEPPPISRLDTLRKVEIMITTNLLKRTMSGFQTLLDLTRMTVMPPNSLGSQCN